MSFQALCVPGLLLGCLRPVATTEKFADFFVSCSRVTQVVANLGAMCGGTVVGYLSHMLGRRFSIIYICIIGGALLYPYSFTGNEKVIAAAFFEQSCVQGEWTLNFSWHVHLADIS